MPKEKIDTKGRIFIKSKNQAEMKSTMHRPAQTVQIVSENSRKKKRKIRGVIPDKVTHLSEASTSKMTQEINELNKKALKYFSMK